MSSAMTVLGLLALPAIGVELTKKYVDEKNDTAQTIATKVATVYGGLAVASYALSAMADDDSGLHDLAKGGMYGTGTVGGLALGARLFGFTKTGAPDVKAQALPAAVPAAMAGVPAAVGVGPVRHLGRHHAHGHALPNHGGGYAVGVPLAYEVPVAAQGTSGYYWGLVLNLVNARRPKAEVNALFDRYNAAAQAEGVGPYVVLQNRLALQRLGY